MYAVENEALPQAGHAEIRIVAATPEAARAVAEVIRRCFAGTEQRSYPAPEGGTRLHLTVDTESAAGPARSWLTTSRPSAHTSAQGDEV
ncbi:hypothetical protein OG978_19415 [Streptomyces sp. NBC_01591]|uniref:hypothetical protein n=1 Tax=Streptomyces sp. NBC_01591 TaxID=2975888 RepID=UPI002DD9C43D|nr:hypothetical protein [Streptomyces sp. NBC_01591]WSD69373.1 hypothetical protein OG978_19415 [Streptomyces sp. NBC_01591]